MKAIADLLQATASGVTAIGRECTEHPLRVAKGAVVVLTIAGAEALMDHAGIFAALVWVIYLMTVEAASGGDQNV